MAKKESPYLLKAEELLWKRVFYDVIQKCKQHREVSEVVGLIKTTTNHLPSDF